MEAGLLVQFGDAAEGEDGDGVGEGADGGQLFEAGAGEVVAALGEVEGFAEDGAEEDEVGWIAKGGRDLGAGVAGFADGGGGQAVGAVEGADLGGGEAAGGGGEVDSVGSDGEGYVGAGVDEEAGGGGVTGQNGEDFAGEVGQFSGGQVLFAELEELKSCLGKPMNLLEDGFRSRLGQAVPSGCDRVADHGLV